MKALLKKPLFWAILALVLAGAAIYTLATINAEREAEIARLEGNQTTLLGEVEHYESKTGELVASVQSLTLQRDEFKELLKAERRKVESLGIRIKELESFGQTSTDTDVEIEAPIVKPDTLIIHEPIAGTFEWEDAWVRVSGEVHPDMIRAKINITDTITIVAHRKARQWLFFRCKGKIVRYDALSSNPHTSITDIRYVELTE
jgi:hypothetical protein